MDNLSVHKAKAVTDLFEENFRQQFLPPYSCALNPIERLWSVIKHYWTKGMHNFTEDHLKLKEDLHRVAIERLETIIGKQQKIMIKV